MKKLKFIVAVLAIANPILFSCKKEKMTNNPQSQDSNKISFTAERRNEHPDIRVKKVEALDINSLEYTTLIQNRAYFDYSTESFGQYMANLGAYITFQANSGDNSDIRNERVIAIPINDEIRNGVHFKRNLITYYDKTSMNFKSVVFEISTSVSELTRLKSLPETSSANLSGSMRLYTTTGKVIDAADFENGVEIPVDIKVDINDPEVQNKPLGWFNCMKGFFNSDAGVVAGTLGAAGGLGCVACGAVGGIITGAAGLGCLGAIF